MKYKELNDALISCFPALKQFVTSEMNTFECYLPGPHVLYANVLNPYLRKLLQDENDPMELQRVFHFFEELAKSGDEEVRNLLQVTLLEALWDDKGIYEKSGKYMLPLTKQINNLIGDYLKIPSA